MADLCLATAGNDIKLWDTDNYNFLRAFTEHTSNICSIHWSQENTFLLSAAENGEKIALTYLDSEKSSEYIAQKEKVTSVALNSTSRYVVGGSVTGLVHIWDLTNKILRKTYYGQSGEITGVKFNNADETIATGSTSGSIVLYNVINGVASAPLICPKQEAVNCLEFSVKRKSLLASGCECGAINLWDTNRRKLVQSITSSHVNPVTDLAFSPINDELMMSVGLDKRFVCYNVNGKVPLYNVVAESPLTSLCPHSDGKIVALGTSLGKVLIFDLRKGRDPLHTFQAHSSSVRAIRFQYEPKSDAGKVKAKKKSILVTTPRNLPISQSVKPYDPMAPANINKLPNGFSAFSPLNNADGMTGVSPVTKIGGGDYVNNNKPFESNGVLSPLNAGDFIQRYAPNNDRGVASFTGKLGSLGHESTDTSTTSSSTTSSHAALFSPHYLPPKEPLTAKSVPRPSSDHTVGELVNSVQSHTVVKSEPSVDYIRATGRVGTSPDKKALLGSGTPQSVALNGASGNRKTVGANEHSGPSVVDSASQVVQSRGKQTIGDTPRPHSPEGAVAFAQGSEVATMSPAIFHTEMIKNMVTEAMEEIKDEMRMGFMRLHMDMVKLHYQKQEELRVMIQELSVNDQLVAEVERLREENKRLKKTF